MNDFLSAIVNFLERLGGPVYRNSRVPPEARPPYIVFSTEFSGCGEAEISVTRLHAPGRDDPASSEFIQRVEALVPPHGSILNCGGGRWWIRRDKNPWLGLRTWRGLNGVELKLRAVRAG